MDVFMNGSMHRWMHAWMGKRTDALNAVEIGCACVCYELHIKFYYMPSMNASAAVL